MLEAKGKVWKASKQGGHVVYIPTDIVNDSAYNFQPKDEVQIILNPQSHKLTIAKVKSK